MAAADPSRLVRLHNGAVESFLDVSVSRLTLMRLMREHPTSFSGLVMLCRDQNHELPTDTGLILRDYNTINPDRQPYNIIKNIVLSGVKGEGSNIKFYSPLPLGVQDEPGNVVLRILHLYRTSRDLYNRSSSLHAYWVVREMQRDYGNEILSQLERDNIRGNDILVLYHDVCGDSLSETARVLNEGTAVKRLRDNPRSSFHPNYKKE